MKYKEKKKRKKINKTRKKAIKSLIDFSNFIKDEIAQTSQKGAFSLAARNVKQEITDSY